MVVFVMFCSVWKSIVLVQNYLMLFSRSFFLNRCLRSMNLIDNKAQQWWSDYCQVIRSVDCFLVLLDAQHLLTWMKINFRTRFCFHVWALPSLCLLKIDLEVTIWGKHDWRCNRKTQYVDFCCSHLKRAVRYCSIFIFTRWRQMSDDSC